MNRKLTIVLAVVALVLLSGIGTGVYFLYHGSSAQITDSRSGLFAAVPSDAVAAVYVNDLQTLALMSDDNGLLCTGGKFSEFMSAVAGGIRGKGLSSVKGAPAVLSYHYDGRLVPLLAVDVAKAGRSDLEDCAVLCSLADSLGVYAHEVDCASIAGRGTYLSRRRLLLVSASELLIDSSRRHISEGISVLSQKGFADIMSTVQGGKGQIYINGSGVTKLFSGIFTREYSKYGDFCSGISSWTGLSLDGVNPAHAVLSGQLAEASGYEDYVRVYRGLLPEKMMAGTMAPSTTVSLYSQPMGDVAQAIAAYARFADTRKGKAEYEAGMSRLEKRAGISPSKWARQLDVKEVATVSFPVGGKLEKVLILRVGKASKRQSAEIRDFEYSGFAAALFGNLFSASSEAKYTEINDWIVVGSAAAVGEYAGGKALETTLAAYVSDSGCGGRLDAREVNFLAYASLKKVGADKVFQRQFAECMDKALAEAEYVPMVVKLAPGRGGVSVSVTADRIFAKAEPVAQVVPETPAVTPETPVSPTVQVKKPGLETPAKPAAEVQGPFKVKNSATGKMNSFYQDSSLNVCLDDEKGVRQWSVKIGSPICGRAGTIDYYNNRKLQILFAAGSKIYLIDRLGRHVKGFPIDLGKEIQLGPDIYDFNNFKKYNVVVLHTDNTIEMYNLKGQKHAQWKGIHPSETITGLPELLKDGGKSYWVVKTASQTLTYPFYGGEPVKR